MIIFYLYTNRSLLHSCSIDIDGMFDVSLHQEYFAQHHIGHFMTAIFQGMMQTLFSLEESQVKGHKKITKCLNTIA